jgi:hypothetical protein
MGFLLWDEVQVVVRRLVLTRFKGVRLRFRNTILEVQAGVHVGRSEGRG